MHIKCLLYAIFLLSFWFISGYHAGMTTAISTSTESETSACPAQHDDALALPPITLTQDEQNGGLFASIESSFLPVMLDTLNAGGSPEDLQAALTAHPVLFEGRWNTELLENRTRAALTPADLDGDGTSEIVALVSIYFGAGYEGYVFILNCADGQYQAKTIGDVIGLVNRETDTPRLEMIDDLNDDGLLEIVVSHYTDWSAVHHLSVYSYDMRALDAAHVPDAQGREIEMIGIR